MEEVLTLIKDGGSAAAIIVVVVLFLRWIREAKNDAISALDRLQTRHEEVLRNMTENNKHQLSVMITSFKDNNGELVRALGRLERKFDSAVYEHMTKGRKNADREECDEDDS